MKEKKCRKKGRKIEGRKRGHNKEKRK